MHLEIIFLFSKESKMKTAIMFVILLLYIPISHGMAGTLGLVLKWQREEFDVTLWKIADDVGDYSFIDSSASAGY